MLVGQGPPFEHVFAQLPVSDLVKVKPIGILLQADTLLCSPLAVSQWGAAAALLTMADELSNLWAMLKIGAGMR